MIENQRSKINYIGIFATNASTMLFSLFLLFFLSEDLFKTHLFPLGTILGAIVVSLAFIPRFLDDIRGACNAIAAGIISEAVIISLFIYATGIRPGMLVVEKGTALDGIMVFLAIYTFIFFFYTFQVNFLGRLKVGIIRSPA